jgi:hypothetical protein
MSELFANRHPTEKARAVMPNGQITGVGDAMTQGHKVIPWPESERIAAPHPQYADHVVTTRGNVVMSVAEAKLNGFSVVAAAPGVGTPAPTAARSWRATLLSLPDAHARPSAAAELKMRRRFFAGCPSRRWSASPLRLRRQMRGPLAWLRSAAVCAPSTKATALLFRPPPHAQPQMSSRPS